MSRALDVVTLTGEEYDAMQEAIERLRELADSEGTRAVEYLRRARKSEANVARLMLEEEGAKDAFAHVVQQKHDADAECKRLRGLLDGECVYAVLDAVDYVLRTAEDDEADDVVALDAAQRDAERSAERDAEMRADAFGEKP